MTTSIASDLLRWRRDTPGCDRVVHLNNAGAALSPRPVREAITRHLALEQEVGGYEAAEAQVETVRQAYDAVGELLGTRGRNIAMVQNSTVAYAQALSALDLGPGDRILTSNADYASNQIMFLSLAQRRGVEVVRVSDMDGGGVDPDDVRRQIAVRRPALVALTWIPTNSGLVQSVEAVGEVCRDAGIAYLIDACQAVGQLPIDVSRLHCDYLAGAARKFLRGPRGLGFLYVSDRALKAGAYPLLVDMRGATWKEANSFALAPDARRFETWEFAFALVLGLGAAASYATAVGLDVARDRARQLAAYTRSRLTSLPRVRVLDRGTELCAIVTASFTGWDSAEIKLRLRARAINTSSPSREDAVLDMDSKRVESALRISPHYYNTEEEIDTAVETLREILST